MMTERNGEDRWREKHRNSTNTRNLSRYVTIFVNICSSARENLTLLHVNDKSADQPVHPHNLINMFVKNHEQLYNIILVKYKILLILN